MADLRHLSFGSTFVGFDGAFRRPEDCAARHLGAAAIPSINRWL